MQQPPRPPRYPERDRIRTNEYERSDFGDAYDETASAGNPVTQGVQDARDTLSRGADSVGNIFGSIIEDLQGIVRGEVQLAKTEVKEEATRMGSGAGMIAAAAFLGLVGFIFLMLSVTYILNQWIEMWMAAGIVALVLLAIAAIIGMKGKSQVQEANLVPEKTIESVKEDQEWAKRQMNSVKK